MERFCHKQGQTKGIKDFISVLMLYKDHDAGEIESAVEAALTANAGSSEAVKHILIDRKRTPGFSFDPLDSWQTLPPADVSVYEQIGGDL